jgi:formylglycine-generating enzyme required for sulfatase activity
VAYGFDYYCEKPTNTLLPATANYNYGEKALNRTRKVGSYKPNRLGLYDMHGNVGEWCHDEIPGDPKGLKAASRRVHRGGGWDDDAGDCRAASRTVLAPPSRNDDLGLRLARVPVSAGAR